MRRGRGRRLGQVREAERRYREALALLEAPPAEARVAEPPGEPPLLRRPRGLTRDATLAAGLRDYATLLRASGRRTHAGALRRRARTLTDAVEERRRVVLPHAAPRQQTEQRRLLLPAGVQVA